MRTAVYNVDVQIERGILLHRRQRPTNKMRLVKLRPRTISNLPKICTQEHVVGTKVWYEGIFRKSMGEFPADALYNRAGCALTTGGYTSLRPSVPR